MDYINLGTSSLNVSKICLGTMMMGSQNNIQTSKQIMSEAFEAGINFFDTAEMYSVPPNPDTQGNSENYIGDWFKETGNRDKLILATKVTGRSDMTWVRGKENKNKIIVDRDNINYAVDQSLKRLKTDYIDLYQVHWPDRPLPMFGMDIQEAALDDPKYITIAETLDALADLVKAGKIRYVGVSNENLNGVKEYKRLADEAGLPMIASIQNAYSLVNRIFEKDLAEYCLENQIGLMPYSILAMGFLTGKYMNGEIPKGSRKDMFKNTTRYTRLEKDDLLEKYKALSKKEGLTMNELAHAFVYQQDFVDSTIIGATSSDQLQQNLKAYDIKLSDATNEEINQIHEQEPNPCP